VIASSAALCRPRAATLALWLALVTLTVHPARAQTAGGSGNVAEALFRDGVTLFDAGRVHEACEKFAESFRLDPANGTLQDLALCHEREGKIASAWAEFSQLAGRAARAEQREREVMARTRAAELAPRVTRVQLTFAGDRPSNVERVEIDGQELRRAAWTSPLPLDPGTHSFLFAAKGKASETRSVAIAVEGRIVRVDVPMLVAEVSPPSVAVTRDDRTERRTLALVAGGVGVVAVGTGAYFGLRALAKKSDGDARCSGRLCDAEGLALEDQAHSSATLSTIAFGLALAALGVGTYAWLTAPVRVVPDAHARGAGVHAELRW
jgi:hypothetical protein